MYEFCVGEEKAKKALMRLDLMQKKIGALRKENYELKKELKKRGDEVTLFQFIVVNVQNTNGTLVNSLLDQQDKLSKENEQLKQELESLKNAQITHNAES